MKIGFIGLGRMGQGMARNLVKAGTPLLVYDMSAAAVQALVDSGAQAAASVADLARQCQLIFTSLPGPVQVEEVMLGADGIAAHMQAGTTVFDLTTSSRTLACRVYEEFKKRGASYLDAPVSGGPAGAASGQLGIWVGGDQDAYDRHVEVLSRFSNATRLMGGIGTGTVAKLAHNVLGYVQLQACAEVFTMAAKAGVDPLDLWEAMRMGLVGKRSPLDALTAQFLPGEYEKPAFALKLGHKDAYLATTMARELGVPMQLCALTVETMTEAVGRGLGEQDSRAFMKLQLERAGVNIAVDPERLQKAIAAQAQKS